MKRTVQLVTLFALFACMVSSCSETVKPIPYTYTRFFTGDISRTWKVAYIEDMVNGVKVDTYANGCFSDDQYTFYSGIEKRFEVKMGNIACSNDPDGNIEDSWGFNNASATLTMVTPFLTPDFSLPFIIREASDAKFVAEIFLDEAATESYRIHFAKSKED